MRIGIYPNVKKQAALPILRTVVEFLQPKVDQLLIPEEAAREMGFHQYAVKRDTIPPRISLALTLGGDGTLLSVAKETAAAGVPVCGINLGHLGFLTHIEVAQLVQGLEKLVTGSYLIEERLMLDSFIRRDDRLITLPPALNDVVVTKGGFARLIRLNLFVAGQLTESYPADGLIVSTPTGSTGYSLSAGGPIISPQLNVMVITPICPHSLNARPLIVSAEEEVHITLQTNHDDVALTVDGQRVYSLLPDDTVELKRSPHKALLVRFPDSGFYQTLHAKLRRDE